MTQALAVNCSYLHVARSQRNTSISDRLPLRNKPLNLSAWNIEPFDLQLSTGWQLVPL